jgi:hypothetical protein
VVLALGIGFKKRNSEQRNARDRRLVALCHGDGPQGNMPGWRRVPITITVFGPKCFVRQEIHFDRRLTPA